MEGRSTAWNPADQSIAGRLAETTHSWHVEDNGNTTGTARRPKEWGIIEGNRLEGSECYSIDDALD